jgi:hypothetical protein
MPPPPSLTLPRKAGESHVGVCKLLQIGQKSILKVAPDLKDTADGTIFGVFFGVARPACGQCAARSDGDFVHRLDGDAVRGDELHRHGAVCADEGLSLARCSGAQERTAEPRHVQPCVPHARSGRVRESVPALYESLCTRREDQAAERGDCARRQSAAARLRARQEPHAACHGDGLGGTDAHGAGQCACAGQQRGRRRPATARTAAAQRLRSDGRCTALSSRHGQGDCGAERRLRAGREGEPAGAVGRRQGCHPGSRAQGQGRADHDRRRSRTQGAAQGAHRAGQGYGAKT